MALNMIAFPLSYERKLFLFSDKTTNIIECLRWLGHVLHRLQELTHIVTLNCDGYQKRGRPMTWADTVRKARIFNL